MAINLSDRFRLCKDTMEVLMMVMSVLPTNPISSASMTPRFSFDVIAVA
jgi:hypothetical protein